MNQQSLNTHLCGICREGGHDRRRCPRNPNKPVPKNIARWTHTRRPALAKKYKCPCGKQELNKGNLRRHQRGPNCALRDRDEPVPVVRAKFTSTNMNVYLPQESDKLPGETILFKVNDGVGQIG